MGNSDVAKNKEAFDILYIHKEDIEKKLGIELTWERAEANKASWISYHLHNVSVANEADWPRMAKFHAEWSDKICGEMLQYLQDSDSLKLKQVAGIFREWAVAQKGVNVNLAKCSRTYTRFTTNGMSEILPDIPNAPSGWNTDNHYFYEIINRNGTDAFIQLSISSQNSTDEFQKNVRKSMNCILQKSAKMNGSIVLSLKQVLSPYLRI